MEGRIYVAAPVVQNWVAGAACARHNERHEASIQSIAKIDFSSRSWCPRAFLPALQGALSAGDVASLLIRFAVEDSRQREDIAAAHKADLAAALKADGGRRVAGGAYDALWASLVAEFKAAGAR